MKRLFITIGLVAALMMSGCTKSYKAKPLPFKSPDSYGNTVTIGRATIGAKAWDDRQSATSAFGFDIIGAGMLPVQVVVDNQDSGALKINGKQSFIEDDKGNLWPVLSQPLAYARATRYTQTEQTFKQGAYGGFLGAAAGSVIGAAVGIVTGDNVAEAAGKGAAAGAAAGAALGGAMGFGDNSAQSAVSADLREKSLENRAITAGSLAHGFLFFPAEAGRARQLRLQVVDEASGAVYVRELAFKP
jgi:hypothetical protein